MKRRGILGICLSTFITGIIATLILYPGESLDVHINYYYNMMICMLVIVAGNVSCFVIAEWADEKKQMKKNWLVFIGQNTLVYYMLCSYITKVYNKGMELMHISISNGFLRCIVDTVVICIGCAVIAMVLNRFAPILVGKKTIKSDPV